MYREVPVDKIIIREVDPKPYIYIYNRTPSILNPEGSQLTGKGVTWQDMVSFGGGWGYRGTSLTRNRHPP